MDLRNVDPSPALGANLIMILGSARSGQHVHAFSDRFCRWLRSEHKIRPSPDGLLGRQQLKVMKRRAAKKIRAMALAGATGFEDRIDRSIGVPDWVCVHLGSVPAAPGSIVTVQKTREGFIGFDDNANSVTLVVQILTEERRAELELEDYWNFKLDKSRSKIDTDVQLENLDGDS
jgi:Ribosomal silencing factor during starvation